MLREQWLFVWNVSSHLRIFPSYYQLRAANFDQYSANSWPLSSENCLECQTVTSDIRLYVCLYDHLLNVWHACLLPNVWQWSCHYMFQRLRSVTTGIRTPNLLHLRQMLWPIAPRPARSMLFDKWILINLDTV